MILGTMERIEQGKTLGMRGELVREGLTEKGMFESKVEEGKGKNQLSGRRVFPGRGSDKSRGLEEQMFSST